MADQFAINPYAPPKANLDAWVTPAMVEAFPRLSTWWVLVRGVSNGFRLATRNPSCASASSAKWRRLDRTTQ